MFTAYHEPNTPTRPHEPKSFDEFQVICPVMALGKEVELQRLPALPHATHHRPLPSYIHVSPTLQRRFASEGLHLLPSHHHASAIMADLSRHGRSSSSGGATARGTALGEPLAGAIATAEEDSSQALLQGIRGLWGEHFASPAPATAAAAFTAALHRAVTGEMLFFPKLLLQLAQPQRALAWRRYFHGAESAREPQPQPPLPLRRTVAGKTAVCLGSPLRFSGFNAFGEMKEAEVSLLAGKLIDWYTWHTAYGADPIVLYMAQRFAAAVFPEFHLSESSSSSSSHRSPGPAPPSCRDWAASAPFPQSQPSLQRIPKGAALLRAVLYQLLCRGRAQLRLWHQPPVVLHQSHYYDQEGVIGHCVAAAAADSVFVMQTDLDEFPFPRHWKDLSGVGAALGRDGAVWGQFPWKMMAAPALPPPQQWNFTLAAALCGDGDRFIRGKTPPQTAAANALPQSPAAEQWRLERSQQRCGIDAATAAAAAAVALKPPVYFVAQWSKTAFGGDRIAGKWFAAADAVRIPEIHSILRQRSAAAEATTTASAAFHALKGPQPAMAPSISGANPAYLLHYRDDVSRYWSEDADDVEEVSEAIDMGAIAAALIPEAMRLWREALGL